MKLWYTHKFVILMARFKKKIKLWDFASFVSSEVLRRPWPKTSTKSWQHQPFPGSVANWPIVRPHNSTKIVQPSWKLVFLPLFSLILCKSKQYYNFPRHVKTDIKILISPKRLQKVKFSRRPDFFLSGRIFFRRTGRKVLPRVSSGTNPPTPSLNVHAQS